MKGHFTPHSEDTKKKMREAKLRNPVKYWLGKELPKSFRDGQKAYMKGRPSWRKGKKFPNEKKSEKWHKVMKERMTGAKNPLWKGGITPINTAIRMSAEYKLWRIAVFTRDNFMCIWCGIKDRTIQADHIKPFAYFPELRFAIDNGRTLCKECHKKTDTYMWKGRKYE